MGTHKFYDMKLIRHNYYSKKYRMLLITLDVLFVIGFLFNLGAVAITNAMISHNNADVIEFTELNPANRDTFGVDEKGEDINTPVNTEDTVKINTDHLWMGVLTILLSYGFMAAWYIVTRLSFHQHHQVFLLVSIIVFWLTIILLDFFNDFGFWIGLKIAGM